MTSSTSLARFRGETRFERAANIGPKTSLRELWADGVASAAALALAWLLAHEIFRFLAP